MRRLRSVLYPNHPRDRSRAFVLPGLSLFVVGTLMLVGLTAFRPIPWSVEREARADSPGEQEPRIMVTMSATPRGPFLNQVRETASAHPSVSTVAEVRSGTRWLAAWTADGSSDGVGPPPGYMVPMDVAAVDPAQYLPLVDESLVSLVQSLDNGGAIISRTGASLRGIQEHGVLEFQGQHSIPVFGVVEDEVLRHHEILVSHATGNRIGLNNSSYLAIGLNDPASGGAVEESIRAVAPPEGLPHVRGPEGTGVSAAPSPLLTLAQIKSIFGEFPARLGAGINIHIHPDWIEEQTEVTTIPVLGTFRCHKKMIPQIKTAFDEVEASGLMGLVRPGDFGGCLASRFVRAGVAAGLSRHAWGIAFDFNVSTNLYGAVPTMDLRLVEIMERHGFSWGGHWRFPDGMHFEYVHDGPGS